MTPVAKGVWNPDTGYSYICANCNGTNRATCTHCYGLNYPKLLEAFAVARGARYYAILKAILSIKGKAIYDRAREVAGGGKLSPADLCELLVEFEFPPNRMKPLVEWLEETRILPTGAYGRLREMGFRVSAALEALGLSEHRVSND
jgi:hypothetical protein